MFLHGTRKWTKAELPANSNCNILYKKTVLIINQLEFTNL